MPPLCFIPYSQVTAFCSWLLFFLFFFKMHVVGAFASWDLGWELLTVPELVCQTLNHQWTHHIKWPKSIHFESQPCYLQFLSAKALSSRKPIQPLLTSLTLLEVLLARVGENHDWPVIMFILEFLDKIHQVSIFDFLRRKDVSLI